MYGSGSRAKGLCDRCGFSFPLAELRAEYENERPNGLRVCSECLDEDHPQLQRLPRTDDPKPLKDPRPDIDRPQITSYFGWNPIGGALFFLELQLGDVRVDNDVLPSADQGLEFLIANDGTYLETEDDDYLVVPEA